MTVLAVASDQTHATKGMNVHLQQLSCAWNRLCFTGVCVPHGSRSNHQTASVCRESALRKHNQIVLLHLKNVNMINIELNSGYKHTYQRVVLFFIDKSLFMWGYGGVPWHNIIQLYQLISLFLYLVIFKKCHNDVVLRSASNTHIYWMCICVCFPPVLKLSSVNKSILFVFGINADSHVNWLPPINPTH